VEKNHEVEPLKCNIHLLAYSYVQHMKNYSLVTFVHILVSLMYLFSILSYTTHLCFQGD